VYLYTNHDINATNINATINRALTKKETSLREKFQECTHTPVVVGRTTAASTHTTPHSAAQNPLTASLGCRSSAASIGGTTATPTATTTAGGDATVTPGKVLFKCITL
jgi:hypothetical protein